MFSLLTVVGKVEAAVDPDAVLRHLDVLLRVDRPLALGRDELSLDGQRYAWKRSEQHTFALWRRCRLDMSNC